jgi:DNA-binding MarR family transcriptional regulator
MDDEHHVMMALGSLMEQVRHAILTDGEDGLRPSHFRVIGSVPPDSGITVTELAERVGMTKQGIGQFVTQLTRDGYLLTESDPRDRRVRVVRRTRLGNDATHRLTLVLQRLEEQWARHVGTRRYRQFRLLLDEIADINASPSALEPRLETR